MAITNPAPPRRSAVPGAAPIRSAAIAAMAPVSTEFTILNSVLTGAIAAIAALRIGAAPGTALLLGGAGFVIAIAFQSWYSQRGIAKLQAGHRPMFPSPEGESPAIR